MVLMAGYDLPVRAIRQQVASALDLIIQLERLNDGSRRITAISEVQGMESDVITLQDVFEFELENAVPGRTILGQLRYTGLRPTFLPKFERRGVELPARMRAGDPAPVQAKTAQRMALR
jgi:pilus assembly protein CpaF